MANYIGFIFNKILTNLGLYRKEPDVHYLRSLSPPEENYELYNRVGIWTSSRIVFIETKEAITREIMFTVLEYIIKMFPILRLKIKQSEEKMYWQQMEHITPDLQIDDSGDWMSCFAKHSNTVFDSETGPLWKYILITNVKIPNFDEEHFVHQYGLLFIFNHALLDGNSSLLIFQEIQQVLNAIFSGKILDMPQDAPLINKPLCYYMKSAGLTIKDKLFDFVLCLPGLKTLFCKLVRGFLVWNMEKENLYTKHIDVPINGVKCTAVRPIPFSKEETEKLLSACKKHQVTVQSALQTASAIALCNLLRNPLLSSNTETLPSTLSVDVGCAANMKNLLADIPKKTLGCYISMLYAKLEVGEDSDFWELALESRNQIHQAPLAAAATHQKVLAFNRKIQLDLAKVLAVPPYHGRYPGFLLLHSNLGNCSFLDMDDSVHARINGQVAGTSQHRCGPIFDHSVATILNHLNWNVIYFPNIHSKKVVDFYVSETKRIITQAINGKEEAQSPKHLVKVK